MINQFQYFRPTYLTDDQIEERRQLSEAVRLANIQEELMAESQTIPDYSPENLAVIRKQLEYQMSISHE